MTAPIRKIVRPRSLLDGRPEVEFFSAAGQSLCIAYPLLDEERYAFNIKSTALETAMAAQVHEALGMAIEWAKGQEREASK